MNTLPSVEFIVVATGTYTYAGSDASDENPDTIEVLAVDGDALFRLQDNGPVTPLVYPETIAPWWPAGGALGSALYSAKQGVPRKMSLKGVKADSFFVVLSTATEVIVTLSKER